MSRAEQGIANRFIAICEMTNDRLRNMTSQERDRTMQIYLAQARGPARNVALLCEMTDMLLRARRTGLGKEQQNVCKHDS